VNKNILNVTLRPCLLSRLIIACHIPQSDALASSYWTTATCRMFCKKIVDTLMYVHCMPLSVGVPICLQRCTTQ